MPFYKDTDNKVHFLDSSDYEHLLPVGCSEITEEEAAALAPKPSASDAIKQRIAELEAFETSRRLREAVLTDAGRDWLTANDAAIKALRAQL